MAQQRMSLWATEEIDEDLQDVDLSLTMGAYGQNGFDDGEHANIGLVHFLMVSPIAMQQPQFDESTLIAVQHQMAQQAQQAAFSQIPDVVKGVRVLAFNHIFSITRPSVHCPLSPSSTRQQSCGDHGGI